MAINQDPDYVADDEATFMSSYKVHQVAAFAGFFTRSSTCSVLPFLFSV
jgi:hypothetical protein